MCGLFGIIDSLGVPRELPLAAMRDAMAHRGPDAKGSWQSSCGRVALAHRRLAVIDLSPESAQPLTSHDGAYTIAFNGEIYNYRELRDELRKLGHRFKSEGDTEVIIESYRAWGRASLDRFNGMFAFALYDANLDAVLLARDRAGEKPLYYRWNGHRLAFASELKSLLLMPDAAATIDLSAFNYYLAYGYTPPGQSMLSGYRKLPQGHSLWVELGKNQYTEAPYWSLPAEGSLEPLDGPDADRVVEDFLIRSVRRQLVADVPIGILLSGGLDSSLITALAAVHGGGAIRTFNVSFPGAGSADESAHARLVADYFGTEHHEIPVGELTHDILDTLARQYDDPIADHAIIPTSLLSRAVRAHCTVALTGDGADELFGGYHHYNWFALSERARAFLPGSLRKWIASSAFHLPLGSRGRNHLLGLGMSAERSVSHINLFFDSNFRERLVPAIREMPAEFRDQPESFKGSLAEGAYSPVGRATRSDFRSTLVDAYLVKTDRASMLHSLELRAPFLDVDLIDLAFGRIAPRLRATECSKKILLKRLAARLLPKNFDRKRKQGFTMPLGRLFGGSWRASIDEVFDSAPPEIFDRRVIETLWRDPRQRESNTSRLFSLVMFEKWRRVYGASMP